MGKLSESSATENLCPLNQTNNDNVWSKDISLLSNKSHTRIITKNREYQFDALGRLTTAKGKASNQWTQTYVYDRFGINTHRT